MEDEIVLKEEDRIKLDAIVSKMISNNEPEDNIKFVVNDFKSKYGTSDGGDSSMGKSEQKDSEAVSVRPADWDENQVFTDSASETAQLGSEETPMDGGSVQGGEADISPYLASTNIGDAAADVFGNPPQKQERKAKFVDEETGVSRYEQAGIPDIITNIESTQSKLEKLQEELDNEPITYRYDKMGFPVEEKTGRARQLEAEISVNSKMLKDFNKKKTIVDAEYGAEMYGLGGEMDNVRNTMNKEQSLEGSAMDFVERGAAKAIRFLSPAPLPMTDAEAKQKAKYIVEEYADSQIKDIEAKVMERGSKIVAKDKELADEFNATVDALNEAYANKEIDYQTYESNYQESFKNYEETKKSIDDEFKKYSSFANDYSKALIDLSIINRQDDLSGFESGTKSFANELIKTPRQVAGLIKATTPLLSIASTVSGGGAIPQEVFIAAFSPVTDWLSDATEANLLRIDEDETAANMIGDVAGQLAKITGAGYAAPLAGLTVSAGMAFDEMYQSVKGIEGVSEKEAINIAAIYTPIGTAFEYFGARTGIEALGKKQFKDAALKIIMDEGLTKLGKKGAQIELSNRLKNVLGDMTKEFFEEGITEALQGATQEGIKQLDDLRTGEDRFKFDGQSFADNMVESFFYGGIAGSGVAGVTSGGSALLGGGTNNFQMYKQALTDQITVSKLVQKIEKDKTLTEQEKLTALATMQRDADTLTSVDGLNLTKSQEKKAAELITRKKILEEKIDGKDKSLTKGIQEEIKAINASLEEMGPKSDIEQEATTQEETQEATPVDNVKDEAPVQEEVKKQGPPEMKMVFPSNKTLRKMKDFAGGVTERNRIKDEYKELQKIIKCIWKS